jgi:PilZ domain
MGLFAGRGKKRVAKGEVVAIARPDSLGLEHPATTENMSEQGLRLITEQGWKPGDRVLLTTAKTASRIPAGVIYCERLSEKRFAVGLELSRPLQETANPNYALPASVT